MFYLICIGKGSEILSNAQIVGVEILSFNRFYILASIKSSLVWEKSRVGGFSCAFLYRPMLHSVRLLALSRNAMEANGTFGCYPPPPVLPRLRFRGVRSGWTSSLFQVPVFVLRMCATSKALPKMRITHPCLNERLCGCRGVEPRTATNGPTCCFCQ